MFRNRGSLPEIKTNNDNNIFNDGSYNAPHYSNYWNGRFIIIHYDKNFIAIEIISWIIVLLIIGAVNVFGYKVQFQDPIATTKNNFLIAQFIAIMCSITLAGLFSLFTRSSKERLIIYLKIVSVLSIISVIIFLGLKLSMNKKYNETTFGEFYEQYEQPNVKNNNSNKITFNLSGLKFTTLKDAYISDSINAYTNFSVKVILYIAVHIAIIVLLFYLIHRLSSIEKRKSQLSKDDAILYDEEENIKF